MVARCSFVFLFRKSCLFQQMHRRFNISLPIQSEYTFPETHLTQPAVQHILYHAGSVNQIIILKDHADLRSDLAHLTVIHRRNLSPVKHTLSFSWFDHPVNTPD